MKRLTKSVLALGLASMTLNLGMSSCAAIKGTTDNVDTEADIEKARSAVTLPTSTGGAWQWVPIPGAICGDHSDTGVVVNTGSGSDLVIYMEGGGACWDQATCNNQISIFGQQFQSPMTIAAYTTKGFNGDSFAKQFMTDGGADVPLFKPNGPDYGKVGDAFNRSLATNPYKNATWVVIPYCTGDVHVGDAVQAWDSGTQPNMYYHGAANVALDVAAIAASYPNPSRVTLVGTSAGAFGATANAWRVAAAFPNARVDVVADSGPFFNQAGHNIIPNALNVWRVPGSPANPTPSTADASTADASTTDGGATGQVPWRVVPQDCPECFTDLRNTYGYFSRKYPSSRFALISWDADDVISFMYDESPYWWPWVNLPSFHTELASLLRDTIEPLPNIRYFIPSNAWLPTVNSSLSVAEQGKLAFLQNVEHTALGYLNTTATTNNYNLWPGTPHTTKVLGDWLTQMYTNDPNWASITGQGIQTLTGINLAPTSYAIQVGATYQFVAKARDQNGDEMANPPTITWSVSGGGTISSTGLFTAGATAGGPYTITASGGGFSATASVTVTKVTIGETSVLSGIDNPGANMQFPYWVNLPQANVIQSISYHVTTAAGTMRMGIYSCPNVSTQGTLVAQTDEFVPSVGWNTRNVITPTLLPAGSYCLTYTASSSSFRGSWANSVTDQFFGQPNVYPSSSLPTTYNGWALYGKWGHVSIYATFGGTANSAPTVATAAASSANPVTTTTAALTALGADDGGEPALTYTWAVTSAPSGGSVNFSKNGTNGAKSTVATFNKAGSYTLRVTMTDIGGRSTTSSVTVTVNSTQTLAAIGVTPSGASVRLATGGTTPFSATCYDQYGAPFLNPPAVTWTVSGGGTINASTGVFTGTTVGGPYTITATGGGMSNTAIWSVTP